MAESAVFSKFCRGRFRHTVQKLKATLCTLTMITNQFHHKHKEEFGMWVNWKRFSFGALLLASMSLLLFGCGDYSGSQTAQKSISGVASDRATGLAMPDAKVVAYAVDANGVQSSTPLSSQSVQSDYRGRYQLNIPANYQGAVVIEATKSASVVSKLAKVLFAAAVTDPSTVRAAVPANLISQSVIPPVMVSFATDMAYHYALTSGSSTLSSANIQNAIFVSETFFGINFAQTPPPASTSDRNTSQAQQDLIVSIRAINQVISNMGAGQTGSDLFLVALQQPGGIGTVSGDIKTAITASVAALQVQGTLPAGYAQNSSIISAITVAATGIATLDLSDTTAPAAPAGLAVASVTDKRVNLKWDASSDLGEGGGYFVYRADAAGVYQSIGTVTSASYSDLSLTASTSYSYKIVAFDGSRNLSDGSLITASTTATPAADPNRFSISGKVTMNGVGLVNVKVSNGVSANAVTDADGNYTFTGLAAGSYTIAPVPVDFLSFAPASRSVDIGGALVTPGQDFTATLSGSFTGGVGYPDGTVIGGISFPDGTVIGGVTYPAGTIIGGVYYPAGSVIGGVTYPNGTIIGGVFYPAGSVIGGIQFPGGVVIGGVTYPAGTVIGGVSYPGGAVSAGVIFPTQYTISGTVTNSSATPLASAWVTVSVAANTTQTVPFHATTITNGLGNYSIHLPAGSYTISTALDPYVFPDSATLLLDGANPSVTNNIVANP
jgi:hypothetical protein